jgi:hypothetical protein
LRPGFVVRPPLTPSIVGLVATTGTVIVTIAVFSTARFQIPRYLLPVVPSLVLVVALAAGRLRTPALTAAVVAVLSAQYVLAVGQSLGAFRLSSFSYPGLQVPERSDRLSSTLRDIVRATCTAQSAGRINMVGVDYPWLNANVLEMYAAEQFRFSGRSCYYTPLGYAQRDPEAAWKRVEDFKPPYFIDIDYGSAANPLPPQLADSISAVDPFNAINRVIFRRVVRSGLFKLVRGTQHDGLVVFEAPSNAVPSG